MKSLNKNYIAFILCIMLSITIMINYDSEKPVFTRVEKGLLDLSAPVMKIASSSIYFFSNITDFFITKEENTKLKARNDFLEYYFYLYKQTEAENNRLKEELSFSKALTYKYSTAQIIAKNNSSLSQQIIIDNGLKQGLKKGQLVLSKNQLIGRIIWLSENTAKILLITDAISRIPVTSIDSRIKFIAAGQATNYLICKYLMDQNLLKEGELVVTNGDSKSIVPGIIIGSIFKEEDKFYVKPNINLDKLEFVQILQMDQDENS